MEVCFNETWGTICHYIHPWRWNISQANVVCQQLGYSGASKIIASLILYIVTYFIEKSTFGFGRGSLPVLVKYVYCQGYESNLAECTYRTTGLSDCLRYRSDVVGVQCNTSITQIMFFKCTWHCMNTTRFFL